jgi:hypothetical protein
MSGARLYNLKPMAISSTGGVLFDAGVWWQFRGLFVRDLGTFVTEGHPAAAGSSLG